VGGGTNTVYRATELAFSNINRDRTLGLSSCSPCDGVATGLLKTPGMQLKK